MVSDGYMSGWHALLVYNERGEFVQQLGRKGEGPAEFKHHSTWAGEWRGDSIAGFDESLRRLQIWSADGQFARTVQLPRQWVVPYFMGDGRTVIAQAPYEICRGRRRGTDAISYNLYGPDGEFIRELMKLTCDLADQGDQDAPNYATRWVFAAGREHWYAAEWKDFNIEVYDTLGTPVSVLRRPLSHKLFTDAEREEVIQLRLKWAAMGPEGIGGGMMSDF